jgi:hypothetical protein
MGKDGGGAGDAADLLGLAVMCWRVRQWPVSRADRVRPGSAASAGWRCRVRVVRSGSLPLVGCLTGTGCRGAAAQLPAAER